MTGSQLMWLVIKRNRPFFVYLFVFWWFASAQAQPGTVARLSGCISDAETNDPLPGVNVFLSGTTIGAATNIDGCFEFIAPFSEKEHVLVASFVGYQIVSSTLPGIIEDTVVDFSLHPRTIVLDDLEIISSNKEWLLNLERYKKLIFSSTDNASRCKLLNPEILDFEYDEAQDILRATVDEALIIENGALGYRLVFYDAVLVGNEHRLSWGGRLQFIELEPSSARQRRRWEANRLKAYQGSLRHFLSSLVAGTHINEGFRIYYASRPGLLDESEEVFRNELLVTIQEEQEDHVYFQFVQSLLVIYFREVEPRKYSKYLNDADLRTVPLYETIYNRQPGNPASRNNQVSWLVLKSSPLLINKMGYEQMAWAIERSGYWAWERIGEYLPSDYQPE